MDARIVAEETLLLAGMSFYGDPFDTSDVWMSENQIGRLWERFMAYLSAHPGEMGSFFLPGASYEVHITGPETEQEGFFEVFVGLRVRNFDRLPVHLVGKILPSVRYAVFTLEGEAIVRDWQQEIALWLSEHGLQQDHPYNFQLYDARFKGMDRLAESVVDVFIPVIACGRAD
jgi:predicted transcriptional regulator YdeE